LSAAAQAYKVTNIVSDGSVPAQTMDANFINPWAMSTSGTWWISAQGTGYNYIVAPAGTIGGKVIVPSATNQANAGFPAGSVTTGGATGMILANGTKASFIFSTLDGTISGWNSKVGATNAVPATICQIVVNNNAAGASYPGLAILNTSTRSYVLAANFGTGNTIEVYDDTFKATKLAGSFTDPSLPAGYGPFAVHVLGSQVWVSYAQRTATAPFTAVPGRGNGIVSVFDNAGNFVARAVTGGNLNAPWGVAFAPASFGIFSNDLLIGNFADGMINVYDPTSYAYLGQLVDNTGKPLVYGALWELLTGGTTVTGGGASGGDKSTVYFTAGLANQAHGLLGAITNSTTAGSTPTFGFSTALGSATLKAGDSATFPVSVAPVNGFSGTVTLSCTNLPPRASCNFSPTQFSVTPTASATGTVMIQTTANSLGAQNIRRSRVGSIVYALLVPLGSVFLVWRRRSSKTISTLRLLGVAIGFLVIGAGAVGCSHNYMAPGALSTGTPSGPASVLITATSGAVSQQATVSLTVQ
jgi:uncharacterized protein (TIGR03118 family)